jgi:hypothetical protein
MRKLASLLLLLAASAPAFAVGVPGQSVPEPGTLGLIVAAGIGAYLWKRKK